MLTYGSVCSGIEAVSVAWQGLPFKALWFSEIEPFPCAVLAERWPDVPNLGDMTAIAAGVRAGAIMAPDVMVGGTPCQAFSVAGVRAGLSDPRGQLTIAYVELADAIDEKRAAANESPAVFVWENVPGVFSSKDNAFGAFIGLLAGEDCELQPPGKRWANAGCVFGPQRTVAWRILDAQYFGVAQRRRRVFVVASARTDIDPTQILFEYDGVRRDTAPSRGEGQEIAGTFKARSRSGGWSQDVDLAAGGYMQVTGSHWDDPRNPHPTLNQSHNTGGIGSSNQEVFCQRGSGIVQSVFGNIAHTLRSGSYDGSEDGTGRGTPIIGVYRMTALGEYADDETASTIKARDYKDATDLAVIPVYAFKAGQGSRAGGIGWTEEQSPTLTYADSGTNLVPVIAFSMKDHGQDASVDISPALRAGNSCGTNSNGGSPPAITYRVYPCEPSLVAYPILEPGREGRRMLDASCGIGIGSETDPMFTIQSQSHHGVAIAFAQNQRGEVRLQNGDGQTIGPLSAGGGKPGQSYPAIACSGFDVLGTTASEVAKEADVHTPLRARVPGKVENSTVTMISDGMAVRRLTPVECERLQGFPDNFTLIPMNKRKKITADEFAYLRHHFPDITAEEAYRRAADGPRYKAIGNSMAVPVMRWIGKRILLAITGD